MDRFLTDNELKYATKEWLKEHITGTEKLRDRYKLFIDKGSDYDEK